MSAEHWRTIDAFLAEGLDDQDADDQDAPTIATPAAAAPTDGDAPTQVTPAVSAPASSSSSPRAAAAPRAAAPAASRLPILDDAQKSRVALYTGLNHLGNVPRPGGIGLLVVVLVVAVTAIVPVAAGKTRLQHLLNVLTGEEGLPLPNTSAANGGAVGAAADVIGNQVSTLPGIIGIVANGAGALGGGASDLTLPPASPMPDVYLPWTPANAGLGRVPQLWQ